MKTIIISKKKITLFKGLLTLVLMSFAICSLAQNPAPTQSVFSLGDLQDMVLRNHPVVKQAGLLSETAQAKVLQSLGNFDPVLSASFGRKIFGGTEYYNHWDSELKVPLYLAGADLTVGYDRNVGIYNNPETKTSNTGLSMVGLNIPLGQGFLIDARRSTLRQAKIMLGYSEAEKISQINAVWLDAVKAYWNWYYAFKQDSYVNEGVTLAQKRYLALSKQVLLGDKPPIDSVEASITLQDRRVQQQETSVKVNNARLILSNYLWNSAGTPQELPVLATPQDVPDTKNKIEAIRLDSLVSHARDMHPEVLKIQSKQSQLDVEEKYRQELLKPKLNLKGSLLAGRRNFDYVPDYYDFRLSNYKVGIDFTFPLFLREGRGKLREVRLKQMELSYGLQDASRQIQTDLMAAYNSLKAYQGQLEIQTRNIISQEVLVKGEVQKFELGESNLFLINARETKLIDMQIKRIELISSLEKSLADVYYKAGKRLTY